MANNVRKGQPVVIRANYSTRGFVLEAAEEFPDDASTFDAASHQPRLVQLNKGQRCLALGATGDKVYAQVEQAGQMLACALLPDSFDVA